MIATVPIIPAIPVSVISFIHFIISLIMIPKSFRRSFMSIVLSFFGTVLSCVGFGFLLRIGFRLSDYSIEFFKAQRLKK